MTSDLTTAHKRGDRGLHPYLTKTQMRVWVAIGFPKFKMWGSNKAFLFVKVQSGFFVCFRNWITRRDVSSMLPQVRANNWMTKTNKCLFSTDAYTNLTEDKHFTLGAIGGFFWSLISGLQNKLKYAKVDQNIQLFKNKKNHWI